MIEIEEININNKTGYRKIYRDEHESFQIKEVFLRTGRIQRENFTYILLYDPNEIVIRDVYRYVNIELKNAPVNTRELIVSVLKCIYFYLDILNITLKDLDRSKLLLLKDFLYGISGKGQTITFKLLTKRDSTTVNKYISVLRGYLKFLNIDNEFINEKREGETSIMTEYGELKVSRYKISENVMKSKTAPKYISQECYDKILTIIDSKYSIKERIIVKLMYENGLRIGEVLGITLEDIYGNVIVIRNRVSDKWDQRAKTCFKPKSSLDYKSRAYRTYDYGYQTIRVSSELESEIAKYIEDNHEFMSKKSRKNYIKFSVACKVDEENDLEGDNYYLFLNHYGKPLRVGAWNKILRTIYSEVGIEIDKKRRFSNLNHKMRHGYAMKNLKEGKTVLQLKEGMRQRSLTSLSKYINPTREEIYRANNENTKDFNLKYGVKYFDRK